MADLWAERAACLHADPDIFHPEAGDNGRIYNAARKVCDGCPVKAGCLADALDNGEDLGMWGGLTPNERELLRGNNPPRRRPPVIPNRRERLPRGDGRTHGIRATYTGGCNCKECIGAERAYKAFLRARKKASA